jgi:hypothetical protein
MGRPGLRSGTAEPVRAGNDVVAGTYTCRGYPLDSGTGRPLPPCPSCHNGYWQGRPGRESDDDVWNRKAPDSW